MLKITNLKKKYDTFTLDCNLEVPVGNVTGLVGKNGAGKTTTFKAILDLISIDGGSVKLFNKDAAKMQTSDKENLGVVLSDSGFSEYLNIKDVSKIMKAMYKDFHEELFINKCTLFELPLQKKIKEFSSGMKAKLKVLCAMSHNAKLLILDEPTAGLDVVARDELLDMLRDYMEENEGSSILISSHISSDLEGLCDDLYMIDHGLIVLHESMDNLLSEYGILKVKEEQYGQLEKKYLLKTKKEHYGYACLTKQKQYYMDNYPNLIIEKGNLDDIMLLMIKGV